MSKARRLKQQISLLYAIYNKGSDRFASQSPLNVSTAFAYKNVEKLSAVFTGAEYGFLYLRIHNLTVVQFGQEGLLSFIRYELMSNLGCCFSPYHADLHLAGLETLPLRLERHCHNALELAQFLRNHSRVSRVRYPGLPDDPGHEVAERLSNGGFGGLLTFEVDSEKRAFQVINKLKIALRLANLGDAKTLVIHPASTIYAAIPPWQHEALGVNDRLIRVSVGLENAGDIIGDFKSALEG
jgi:O-acetylhomoserine (thiol)-lyase